MKPLFHIVIYSILLCFVFAESKKQEYERLLLKPTESLAADELMVLFDVGPADAFRALSSMNPEARKNGLNMFFEDMNSVSIAIWGKERLTGVDFSIASGSAALCELFEGVRPFIFRGIVFVLESNTESIDPAYFDPKDLFFISDDGYSCQFSSLLMGLSAKTFYLLPEQVVIDLFNIVNSTRTNPTHVEYLFRNGFYDNGSSPRAKQILNGIEVSGLDDMHVAMRHFILSRMPLSELKEKILSGVMIPSDIDMLNPTLVKEIKEAVLAEDLSTTMTLCIDAKLSRSQAEHDLIEGRSPLSVPPFFLKSSEISVSANDVVVESASSPATGSALVLVIVTLSAVFLY